MAWSDARTIAAAWVEKHLPVDLRGQVLQLASFENDAHARFFHNDRPCEFHRMISSAIAREARKRGAKMVYAIVTPERYREWLAGQGKADSDARRIAFVESLNQVIPAA